LPRGAKLPENKGYNAVLKAARQRAAFFYPGLAALPRVAGGFINPDNWGDKKIMHEMVCKKDYHAYL
jgi:hypothetical protein